MSTHAAIGFQNPDGSIDWIYQHHDGHYHQTGTTLFWKWHTENLARALVHGGGLYPAEGVKPYHTIEIKGAPPHLVADAFYGKEEYVYLWRNGEWWTHYRYQNSRQDGGRRKRFVKWHKLRTALMKSETLWLQALGHSYGIDSFGAWNLQPGDKIWDMWHGNPFSGVMSIDWCRPFNGNRHLEIKVSQVNGRHKRSAIFVTKTDRNVVRFDRTPTEPRGTLKDAQQGKLFG